ncbi:Hypothetical_protein [Hexamita inflata]|uniref:Hypothetical_protein n=1 Tax=Hexamita inflata TaxID=28002 RepID=A0AA86TGP9_9EUKA|nr:Hypothetical protein HINF_LOCUS4695 [Hexamita inflata]
MQVYVFECGLQHDLEYFVELINQYYQIVPNILLNSEIQQFLLSFVYQNISVISSQLHSPILSSKKPQFSEKFEVFRQPNTEPTDENIESLSSIHHVVESIMLLTQIETPAFRHLGIIIPAIDLDLLTDQMDVVQFLQACGNVIADDNSLLHPKFLVGVVLRFVSGVYGEMAARILFQMCKYDVVSVQELKDVLKQIRFEELDAATVQVIAFGMNYMNPAFDQELMELALQLLLLPVQNTSFKVLAKYECVAQVLNNLKAAQFPGGVCNCLNFFATVQYADEAVDQYIELVQHTDQEIDRAVESYKQLQ